MASILFKDENLAIGLSEKTNFLNSVETPFNLHF